MKPLAVDLCCGLGGWERGTPYVEKKYVRIVAPTFDQNQKATVTLLLQHWG